MCHVEMPRPNNAIHRHSVVQDVRQ
jgi:hypothetical protein